MAVFAEFEREILRERVRAGLAHARQNGKKLGRPATAVRHASEIRKLHRTGVSKSEIARILEMFAGFWHDLFPGEIGFNPRCHGPHEPLRREISPGCSRQNIRLSTPLQATHHTDPAGTRNTDRPYRYGTLETADAGHRGMPPKQTHSNPQTPSSWTCRSITIFAVPARRIEHSA